MASKIVATIGPATCSKESLLALRDAGMDVARLNGSHADLDWHADAIRLLRETLPDTPILLDIPGRKIRTIQLAHEPAFEAGDTLVLTTDNSHDGHQKVPVNYDRLHQDLHKDAVILADDGTLRFTVQEVDGPDIVCRAEVSGVLRSCKGINVPYVNLETSLVTERDEKMVAFARSNGVDYIGISFVESRDHVDAIRDLVGGSVPKVLAKVENRGGLANVDEVCGAADAIMIDRGDLSVETDIETMALSQKRIIEAARNAGKPVIVATEMLHSMIENPFPTKAEVSDISNAVLDGCDATMLSGETAIGAFPFEAVKVMRTVANANTAQVRKTTSDVSSSSSATVPSIVEDAISMICGNLPISKIVAITRSGFAARTLASHKPSQPVLAVTDDADVARSFNLYYGTEGIYVDIPFSKTSTDHIPKCLEALWAQNKIVSGDLLLITAVGYPRSGNRMNLIQIHAVDDLIANLGWKR